MIKILFFPVVIYLAVYWICYDIFLWATADERSRRTLELGGQNPIQDGMDFARDLVNAKKT